MRFYAVTSWSYVNLDDPGPKKGASDKIRIRVEVERRKSEDRQFACSSDLPVCYTLAMLPAKLTVLLPMEAL